MNRLPVEQQARVAHCLVEGNSIRGTVRLTGTAKNTVSKLLLDVGAASADLLDRELRGLPLRRIGFSRKVENLHAAISLHYAYYNFCRPHITLTKRAPGRYPTTPAMAAGVTDHVWTLTDLVRLIDYGPAEPEAVESN